jgi:hypothetical protein
VTDDSGLAVPGATVTITHTETNQKRDATTNATGGYNFPNIPTGTYQVEINLTGFNTFRARGITVQQNNSVRIDAKLGVGALQETVVVSGTAAILQTESAAVQSVTTSQQIENLPTGRTCRCATPKADGLEAPAGSEMSIVILQMAAVLAAPFSRAYR